MFGNVQRLDDPPHAKGMEIIGRIGSPSEELAFLGPKQTFLGKDVLGRGDKLVAGRSEGFP